MFFCKFYSYNKELSSGTFYGGKQVCNKSGGTNVKKVLPVQRMTFSENTATTLVLVHRTKRHLQTASESRGLKNQSNSCTPTSAFNYID